MCKKNFSAEEAINRMTDRGVRPTAVRILIYRFMQSSSNPVSSLDIETALETVDKSTISRSLSTFIEHDMIHSIDDGSGLLKYEVCRGEHSHSMNDLHVHFRCIRCSKTFCLTSTSIPEVRLPEGFIPTKANYVISGLCDKCSMSSIS